MIRSVMLIVALLLGAQETGPPPGCNPGGDWAVAYQYAPETGQLHRRSEFRPWAEWSGGAVLEDTAHAVTAINTVRFSGDHALAVLMVERSDRPGKTALFYLVRRGPCLWSSVPVEVNGYPFHVDFGLNETRYELFKRSGNK